MRAHGPLLLVWRAIQRKWNSKLFTAWSDMHKLDLYSLKIETSKKKEDELKMHEYAKL